MIELVQSMNLPRPRENVLGNTCSIEHKDGRGQVTKTIDLTRPWRRVKYRRPRPGACRRRLVRTSRRPIDAKRAIELGAEIGKQYEDF